MFEKLKRITIALLLLVILADVSAQESPEASIAVLPFINRNAGPERMPLFLDGFHDELLTRLTKIPGLKVIARSSIMALRETALGLPETGEVLGVANLLEGTFQQSGNRVKISLQLINVRTSDPLWAESYDRVLTVKNIFEIQDEIAESIAGVLKPGVSPGDEKITWKAPTSNLKAYQAVLVSRQFRHRDEYAAMTTAVEYANKAIELDPAYADADVALARALVSGISMELYSADEVGTDISGAIHKAMSKDPENARAWSAWASYQFIIGDPGAENSLQKAMLLNPGNAEVLREYGLALQTNNKPDKALPVLLRARELDPLSQSTLLAVGNTYGALENYSEARRVFSRIREINPSSAMGYAPVAWSFLAEGRLDDAVYWLSRAQAIDPRNPELGGWMVFLHDSLENYLSATEWSDWLVGRITNQPLPMAMLARHYYMTGSFELALQYSNLALRLELPDRLNSEAIFMRVKRDEALANGDPESGIELFATRYPQIFQARPLITIDNISQATDLALLLKLAGRLEEAQSILEAVIAAYNRPFFTNGPIRSWSIPLKAEALSILGDKQGSLAELRRIVDRGWRAFWRWKTDLNPNFNGIRESGEFQIVVRELEADMTRQRSRVHDMVEQGEIAPPAAPGLP